MTEATEARLEQIIKLTLRLDTPTCWMIRELAERALAEERHVESIKRQDSVMPLSSSEGW